MTATVVKINEIFKHPNADTLYVYKVSNELDVIDVQVVANSTNIYKVGDYAVYIKPGSVMIEDELKIGKRKLRGVMSYGMLANITNEPLGKDVSSDWCKAIPEPIKIERTNLKHQKWLSIESFANVRKTLNNYKDLGITNKYVNYTYMGKVKLHGTNAGVIISPDGEVVAQKRSSVIYPDQDNCEFATWVAENKEAFARLANKDRILTIHGEWCGPKIQKGVAASEIPEKIFAIFALQVGSIEKGNAKYIIHPNEILVEICTGPWYILPSQHELDINFYDDLSVAKAANKIEKETLEVENCDPWIKDNFNIEGIGEGLVYYPKISGFVNVDSLKELIFKTKGSKHQVKSNKSSKLVPIDIEKLESVQEFVNMFVTQARLLQAVNEACDNKYDIRLMGTFLKWIAADIQKESVAEFEDSELTWKDVNKKVMTTAREWYQCRF